MDIDPVVHRLPGERRRLRRPGPWGHPTVGTLRASDLLASWLAHDPVHVRQIDRLHRQYLETALMHGCRVGTRGSICTFNREVR